MLCRMNRMCVMALIFLVVAAGVCRADTTSWNFSDDFSATSNPNGAWSCGANPAGGGDFQTYPNAFSQPIYTYGPQHAWVNAWNDMWGGGWVYSTKELTSATAVDPGNWPWDAYLEKNAAYLGPSLINNAVNAVVRWTAPSDGKYAVSASWGSAQMSGVSGEVVGVKVDGLGNSYSFSDTLDGFRGRAINGYSDATGTHPSTTYSSELTLMAGQTLDFIAESNAGAGAARATAFNATISSIPEPGTMLLTVLGSLGLMAYAWRKRR
jgi:hypothetical protein